ncbi:MAG: protein phosphatase 2C domain-containing protein [Acidobacteriota bacterium]|nr:protein phosphatase 2C domain-containing protein [Acidobacteriota bacterium]
MTVNNFQIDSAAISDRGLSEKRPQNEDSYLELKQQGLFAVADGVGGAQAGDVASQMAVEILGEAFINLQKNGDAEEMMKIAIERANEAIFQMSHDLQQLSTMATTIVALHVSGNIATIGHVGDSRLYRLDPKGDFFRETQDHSVVEEEVRAGRMTAAQALNHPSKNIISRALGAEQSVEVDMKTIMIEPNTTFLICSDGITRHIDDFQLRELLLYKDTPADICQRMKEICYERGAEDNLTAVIARVSDKIAEINQTPADLEESTVATARPLQTSGEVLAEPSVLEEEISTQQLVMPVKADSQSRETNMTNETSERPFIQETEKTEKIYRADAENASSSFGKFLSSLTLLILGAGLGAGAFYLLAQTNKPAPTPVIMEMQSPNIPYSSFEDSRRVVDGDPNAFINKSVNLPQDAEGLYLLGRACLLAGKFPEAKKYLEEARNKLAQANVINSKVLATDIALGLTIIDEAAAQNKFQTQIKPNNLETNSQINVNTNTTVQR